MDDSYSGIDYKSVIASYEDMTFDYFRPNRRDAEKIRAICSLSFQSMPSNSMGLSMDKYQDISVMEKLYIANILNDAINGKHGSYPSEITREKLVHNYCSANGISEEKAEKMVADFIDAPIKEIIEALSISRTSQESVRSR